MGNSKLYTTSMSLRYNQNHSLAPPLLWLASPPLENLDTPLDANGKNGPLINYIVYATYTGTKWQIEVNVSNLNFLSDLQLSTTMWIAGQIESRKSAANQTHHGTRRCTSISLIWFRLVSWSKVHWVPFTTSSVTLSTRLQRAVFFASG